MDPIILREVIPIQTIRKYLNNYQFNCLTQYTNENIQQFKAINVISYRNMPLTKLNCHALLAIASVKMEIEDVIDRPIGMEMTISFNELIMLLIRKSLQPEIESEILEEYEVEFRDCTKELEYYIYRHNYNLIKPIVGIQSDHEILELIKLMNSVCKSAAAVICIYWILCVTGDGKSRKDMIERFAMDIIQIDNDLNCISFNVIAMTVLNGNTIIDMSHARTQLTQSLEKENNMNMSAYWVRFTSKYGIPKFM